MSSVSQTTFIYALIDPRDGRIRYVGKANDPQVRLRNHVKESRNGHSDHKSRWIRLLLRENLYPKLLILEECLASDWKERECFYIADYRAKGYDLVNSKDGGDGYEPTEEARARMSAAKKGKPSSNKGKRTPAEIVKKLSDAAKRRWARMTDEFRADYIRKLANHERKPISEETREKIRTAARNRVYTPEENLRNSLRQRSLTKEQILQIKEMLAKGKKQKDIAIQFEISRTVVCNISKGKVYSDWK